jgi:hypothetical protein
MTASHLRQLKKSDPVEFMQAVENAISGWQRGPGHQSQGHLLELR